MSEPVTLRPPEGAALEPLVQALRSLSTRELQALALVVSRIKRAQHAPIDGETPTVSDATLGAAANAFATVVRQWRRKT